MGYGDDEASECGVQGQPYFGVADWRICAEPLAAITSKKAGISDSQTAHDRHNEMEQGGACAISCLAPMERVFGGFTPSPI
jgi:hypothetical protein